MTCSQRQHLQQIGRIRHIKNNNVLCWYRTLQFNEENHVCLNSPIYTYNDVRNYFHYYGTLNGKRILQPPTNIIQSDDCFKIIKDDKISLFDKINLHNETEQLNKHYTIFITILNKLIVKAGNTLKFNIINEEVEEDDDEKMSIKDILIENLVNINEKLYSFSELKQKQTKNNLTAIEKLVIRKFFFIKNFKIDKKCTKDDMRVYLYKYIDKEHLLHRYKALFEKYDETQCDIDCFKDGKERARIKIITDLVNRLLGKSYKSLNVDNLNNVQINHANYVKAIKNISTNSIYFKNIAANRALFHKKKKNNFNKISKNNQQSCCKIIQSLLESYNIILSCYNKSKVKNKVVANYSLSVDEQMKDIFKVK